MQEAEAGYGGIYKSTTNGIGIGIGGAGGGTNGINGTSGFGSLGYGGTQTSAGQRTEITMEKMGHLE